MRFEDPWVLVFLPIFFLAVILFLKYRRKKGVIEYSSVELLRPVRSRLLPWILGGLAVFSGFSLILALARPQISGDRMLVPTFCRDLLFLVDQSQSLRDNPFSGEVSSFTQNKALSQLEAELLIAEELIKTRPNDRIALMLFAGIPTLIWPLSKDHEPTLSRLKNFKQKGTFTVMGPALLAAVDHLEELGKCGRTLIVLTDGYVSSDSLYTPAQQAELRERIKELSIQFYWVKLEVVISQQPRFKELEELSRINNGAVFIIEDTESLQEALTAIQNLVAQPMLLPSKESFVDIYPWFLTAGIIGILCLVAFVEFLIIREVN